MPKECEISKLGKIAKPVITKTLYAYNMRLQLEHNGVCIDLPRAPEFDINFYHEEE